MEGFGRFGCQRRCRIYFLVKSLMVARYLRKGASDLKAALQLALRIALPSAVASFFVKAMEDKSAPLPSKSTLSHVAFILDASFMLYMRDYLRKQFAEGRVAAIHWKLDSSTQGNVDWENSEFELVISDTAEEYLDAYSALVQHAKLALADDDHQAVQDEQDTMRDMSAMIQLHHGVPAGLASKKGDTVHKAHSAMHALFLETGGRISAATARGGHRDDHW